MQANNATWVSISLLSEGRMINLHRNSVYKINIMWGYLELQYIVMYICTSECFTVEILKVSHFFLNDIDAMTNAI